MCSKLFILKEFYFLILELNVGPHHKYSSELLSTKTKESRIKKKKKKVLHNNNNKMDNLHFISNNILTK